MREYTKRLNDFERLPTHKAINSNLMFLFGITMQDFLAALVVFLGISMLPGFLTPFLALGSGFGVVFNSKKLRTIFPKKHFKSQSTNAKELDKTTNEPGKLWIKC